MAPSQLKRLKASLRDQGVVGPQKSKKQKIQASNDRASKDKRIARSVALEGIREQFNPFEVKKLSRGKKFDSTSNGQKISVVGRPGITKGMGEEVRRQTLLTEMQRRRKVGGILDRRFGENDPTMTPEERALERFVKEKQRGNKKASFFDLDEELNDAEELTHLGKSLSLTNRLEQDDFNESGLLGSEDEDAASEGELRGKKRRRLSMDGEEQAAPVLVDQQEDERFKTKQEVMKEVMAKSKFYKYERQKAREDDEDLREKLDEGLADIYELMRGTEPINKPRAQDLRPTEPQINADRAALLEGKDRAIADREYDERLRQMAFDIRSQPTARTKTDEEKAGEDAERLKRLEEKRLSRMRGDEDEDEGASKPYAIEGEDGIEDDMEEAGLFGKGIPTQPERRLMDVEDEDEFVLDDDLIASGSDADLNQDGHTSDNLSSGNEGDEEEKEFIADLISKDDLGRPDLQFQKPKALGTDDQPIEKELAFTYLCPQTHRELLDITKNVSLSNLPTIIQRIRFLYHPKLSSDNKVKLGAFAKVLVEHVAYLANQSSRPSFAVLEALIRHIHSLAKAFPSEIGEAFRNHLKVIQSDRPTSMIAADLILFTAIGTVFPTSDHFHQVVTPAILSIARYLGQKVPESIADLAKGAYLSILCVQYQLQSKRYIPELGNYVLNSLAMLSPTKPTAPFGFYPSHDSPAALRLSRPASITNGERRINFWDVEHEEGENDEEVKMALLNTNIRLVDAMADLWHRKTAYPEIFEPLLQALSHFKRKSYERKLSSTSKTLLLSTHDKLANLLEEAGETRRPLLLHNHKPLAIKTAIPKFEDTFHPDKHYDADRDRAELGKLRAEHKRERKGAMRELRKDASFVARESLREKKERDAEYEKKYRRLVAEIQGEEGKEKNAYEREKRARKGGR